MTDPLILKKPTARIDLAVHYAYIGERDPAAAHRFRLNAEATFAALARTPGMGEPYEVDLTAWPDCVVFAPNDSRIT